MNNSVQRRRLARTLEKYIRLGLYDASLDVFTVCQRIKMSCASSESARDLFAVWELIRLLKVEGRREELKIFCEIYHKDMKKRQNSIKDAVVACAMRHYCDERTVYRRLAYVEERYAQIRGSI